MGQRLPSGDGKQYGPMIRSQGACRQASCLCREQGNSLSEEHHDRVFSRSSSSALRQGASQGLAQSSERHSGMPVQLPPVLARAAERACPWQRELVMNQSLDRLSNMVGIDAGFF